MAKKVRFSNPISSTAGGGGVSNLGLIVSSLMPRTVNVCSSGDDSMFCMVSQMISFFFMICVILFILYLIYQIVTGKIKLGSLFNSLMQ